MSNLVGPIFRRSHLNSDTGTLSIQLSIPFITYPDNGDTLSDDELGAHISEAIFQWATQISQGLVREPIRDEAWRACAALAMQRAKQLEWEAEEAKQWRKVKFYEIFANMILEARMEARRRHMSLTEAFEDGETHITMEEMKCLGVHVIDGEGTAKIKRAKRKGKWRAQEKGAPQGLDDITEED